MTNDIYIEYIPHFSIFSSISFIIYSISSIFSLSSSIFSFSISLFSFQYYSTPIVCQYSYISLSISCILLISSIFLIYSFNPSFTLSVNSSSFNLIGAIGNPLYNLFNCYYCSIILFISLLFYSSPLYCISLILSLILFIFFCIMLFSLNSFNTFSFNPSSSSLIWYFPLISFPISLSTSNYSPSTFSNL